MVGRQSSHRTILVTSLALGLLAGCEKSAYYGPPAPQPQAPEQVQPILLVEIEPPDGATDVPQNVVVYVRFSRAPDPVSVTTESLRVIDEETDIAVRGVVEAVQEGTGEPAALYRFLPAEPLLVPNHAYRIEVTSSIAAADGARLDRELSPVATPCHFTTRGEQDTVPPRFFAFGHRATAVSPTAIRLTWFPAIDNAGGTPPGLISYAIYQGTAPAPIDFEQPAATTSPGALAYVVSGLTPNTTYSFVIHPIDAAGNEDDNTVSVSERTWLAADTTELTILYSADVFATLEPCG